MTFKYVACANFEGGIAFYGAADSARKAFIEFIESGSFAEFCTHYKKEHGDVEVGIFKVIREGDKGWEPESYEDDYDWVLGDKVDSKVVTWAGE